MGSSHDLVAASADLLLGGTCVGCHRPGLSLCLRCGASLHVLPFEIRPSPAPAGLPPVFAVAEYAGVAKQALLAHKEHGRLLLAKPLGRALALSVLGVLARAGERHPSVVFLVPVPSSRQSVRDRGHEPLLRVARECGRSLRATGIAAVVDPALRIVREVCDSAELSALAREANVHAAFAAKPRRSLADRTVVVLDDICTTGATAAETARAVRAVDGDVVGVAVVAATRRLTAARSGPEH